MAKKKRKTLPSDFYEILRRGDIEEIKAVFDKCEITAYAGRCDLNTALHHYGIPAEIIPWLVEQGLDVNTLNSYGRTPLNFHAGNNAKVVKVLFELGGDVAKPDNYGNTPLHNAAAGYVPDNVKLLVEQGVDLNARDNIWKRTPLEEALISCRGIDIGRCAKVAEILVDAGLSGKKITGLLAEIDRKPEDLDAILITHEHSDHIHGVGVLARKYGMDLYANEATWKAMEGSKYLGKVDDSQKHLFEMGKTLTFGDLDVESFGVSHDAAAPQFYRFMKDGKSFVMLTDTGYVSDRMAGIVENADGYLIESNHDVEILRAGSYAWRLKQRILSDLGHLSNEDGADAMIRTLGNKTKKIYLGHLSKENNIKELAHMTMVNQLARADLAVGHDFDVLDTSPDTATPLVDI